MKYYVARDESGVLCLYQGKPERFSTSWMGWFVLLDNSLFPDLKWEDEPIEVELILKEVGK